MRKGTTMVHSEDFEAAAATTSSLAEAIENIRKAGVEEYFLRAVEILLRDIERSMERENLTYKQNITLWDAINKTGLWIHNVRTSHSEPGFPIEEDCYRLVP
jgi:uncharacterized membrane protein YqiK